MRRRDLSNERPVQATGGNNYTHRAGILLGPELNAAYSKLIGALGKLLVNMRDDLLAGLLVESAFVTGNRARLSLAALLAGIALLFLLIAHWRGSLENHWPELVRQFVTIGFLGWVLIPFAETHVVWPAFATVAATAILAPAVRHRTMSEITSIKAASWIGLACAAAALCSTMYVRHDTLQGAYRRENRKPLRITPTVTTEPALLPTPRIVIERLAPQPAPTVTSTVQATPPAVVLENSLQEPTPTSVTMMCSMALPLPAAPPGATYQVQLGDSLAKLAHRFATTVDALVAANSPYYPWLAEDNDCLREDWMLIIPSGKEE